MPEFFGCLMEKFDSITHFMQSGEFEYRVFDMGRKLVSISNGDFENIENQVTAYPYPFQQKAWLALLFWSKNKKKEPVIWFLQFPIDEMGYLKQDARDGFLISLLEQAGKNIQAKLSGGSVVDELSESPYAFKPQEDRLALFHAFASKVLNHKPSRYYQATLEYLSGRLGFDQWQFLGLQGIADVVANLNQNDNEAVLTKAIPSLPDIPLGSFCRALENIELKGDLVQALITKLEQTLEKNNPDELLLQSMILRSLSGAGPKKLKQKMLLTVLNSLIGREIEILAAISGRSWQDLHSTSILDAFMRNLAMQDQTAFNAILTDLMLIPGMREVVRGQLRGSHGKGELAHKLGAFMLELKSK